MRSVFKETWDQGKRDCLGNNQRKIFILGCTIYLLFTKEIKKKLNLNNKIFSSHLKKDLPIIIDSKLFLKQTIDSRTDEMLFGLYSVFEMAEFATANLNALEESMSKLLEVISDKVKYCSKNN